jgi:hypothetical protein
MEPINPFLGMKRAVDPDFAGRRPLRQKTSPEPGARKRVPCRRRVERAKDEKKAARETR